MEAHNLYSGALFSILYQNLRLKNANWLTVAAIIRFFRNILKLLKDDSDDRVLKIYLDNTASLLSTMPWNFLNDDPNDIIVEGDCLSHVKIPHAKSIDIFRGNLLQFLCSLVDRSSLIESRVGSLHENPLLLEISNALPNVTFCFLGKSDKSYDFSGLQYLQYKFLKLMMRLSFQVQLDDSVLVLWLDLLHKYFQDLLLQPIAELDSHLYNCLEESPFRANIYDDEKNITSSLHLQRLAVFLFLKYSIGLVSKNERISPTDACANPDHLLTFDPSSTLVCCNRRKGFLEIYQWLQKHLPADIFTSYEIYFQRCKSFSLSFLKLYMHEDDVLFEMLMLPFGLPTYSINQAKIGTALGTKNDISFLVSDIFNPIHMFHLFLGEILYDHQVLLDYLISKDTGARCVEYLLRCLRLVCDSWNTFLEFPGIGEDKGQACQKRRKLLSDGLSSAEGLSTASIGDDGLRLSFEKEDEKGHNQLQFEDAKNCLLSLRESIENLQQKNLFPYNPQILLKRLRRFQELCLCQ